MIRNEVLDRIERAGGLSKLVRALGSALELKRETGASWLELLSMARQLHHSGGLSFSQSLYAGIAPALFRRSMEQGRPQQGLLATGLVAGRLDSLPSCAELMEQIMRDARARLVALGASA